MTFEEVYNKLNVPHRVYDYFVLPFWKQNCDVIARRLLPQPPDNFLSDQVIIDTMFVTAGGQWLEEELAYVENRSFVEALAEILKEPDIGKPHLMVEKYKTSHNAVHHLYHLKRFYDWLLTNEPERASDDDTIVGDVVEFGGGFGSMARLHHKEYGGVYGYTIIDLPIFSALQWHYLTSIGIDVNLITKESDEWDSDRINIMPLHLADKVEFCTSFISTWALSECPAAAHEYVKLKNWFGARNIMLAHQKSSQLFPNADAIAKIDGFLKVDTQDIPFIPGNAYTFATR